MLKDSLRVGKFVCVAFVISLLCSNTDPVLAQSPQVPRLEGVSYSEIAEWQFRYRGGPGVPGCVPVEYGAFGYAQPIGPPPAMAPCKPRKAKRSKKSK
ncbi:MAG: hypothetical protein AB1733_14530 [Thermodesulfobacteriota bacterium]